MSRPLFPFVLLGDQRHGPTVGDTLPEMQPTSVEPVLISPGARDFRPIVPAKDRKPPAIGAKGVASDDVPKVSPVTDDATPSLNDSPEFPPAPSEPSVDVAKETIGQPPAVVQEPTPSLETGDDKPPVSESTPEVLTNPTSSFLLP